MASPTPLGQDTFSPALLHANAYHRWVFEALAPWITGRVLEVGSGHGLYTAQLRASGHEVVVSDIDPATCEQLAARFSDDPHVRVLRMDGVDESLAEQVGPVDTILAINILEHLADDRTFVTAAGRLLRRSPRGRLVVFAPAGPSLYGSLDRLAGHHRRYDAEGLRALMAQAGLQTRQLRPFNVVGGVGWWLDARLVHHRSIASGAVARQVGLANLLVPVLRRLDAPLRRLGFGQSLVCVAEV